MCEEELSTVSERSWLRQLLSTFWDRDRGVFEMQVENDQIGVLKLK